MMNASFFRRYALALLAATALLWACDDDDDNDPIPPAGDQPTLAFQTGEGFVTGNGQLFFTGEEYSLGVTATAADGKTIESLTITENGTEIVSETGIGTATYSQSVTVTAGAPGDYFYVITVTDSRSVSTALSARVTVESVPDAPVVEFQTGAGFVSGDASFFVGEGYSVGVTAAVSRTGVGVTLESFTLTENGTEIVSESGIGTETYQRAEAFTAGAAGTYEYVLTVTDSRGESTQISATVTTSDFSSPVFGRWKVGELYLNGNRISDFGYEDMRIEFSAEANGLPGAYAVEANFAPITPELLAPETGVWAFDDLSAPTTVVFDPSGVASTATIVGTPSASSLSLEVQLPEEIDKNEPVMRFDLIPE